jgi:hypothetical protein
MPVAIVTDNITEGGVAISVYGYPAIPTDGRSVLGQPAKRVKVLQASDLVQNGGTYWLDGRIEAMPVYTDTTGITEGNVTIAVYVVGGSL